MNAARLNEAADEIRGAINLSTSGGKAHAALDDLLAALDAAEQRAEDFRVTQAALRAALDEAEARAVQAEQERDTQHGRAAGAELERDRLAARAEAAEARLAEQKAAFIAEHETDHAEIRSLQARLAETQNALEEVRAGYDDFWAESRESERLHLLLNAETRVRAALTTTTTEQSCNCSRDRPHVCPQKFGAGWPVPAAALTTHPEGKP